MNEQELYLQEHGLVMNQQVGQNVPEISAHLEGLQQDEEPAGPLFEGDHVHSSDEVVLQGGEADLGGGLWIETGIGEADLVEGDLDHEVGVDVEVEVETKKINLKEVFQKA